MRDLNGGGSASNPSEKERTAREALRSELLAERRGGDRPTAQEFGVASAALNAIEVTTTTVPPADDGECGLIEAIENANRDTAVYADCAAGISDDMIVLEPHATYVIPEAYVVSTPSETSTTLSGLPPIESTIYISGSGSTIERDPLSLQEFRFFYVPYSGTLILNDLTLMGGDVTNFSVGGAIMIDIWGALELHDVQIISNTAIVGGALYNYEGFVDIYDSAILSNTADATGAIFNEDGWLTLVRTTISGNVADDDLRPDLIGGSGILVNYAYYGYAMLEVLSSTVSFNSAWDGSGISNVDGLLWMSNCTVEGNTAAGSGAGVYNDASDYPAFALIEDSEIISNTAAEAGGGGVVNATSKQMTATVYISNSLVSYNVASGSGQGGVGGGIWNTNVSYSATSQVHVYDSIISHNRANNGAGIANAYVSATLESDLLLDIERSAIVHNTTFAMTGNQHGNAGGVFNLNGTTTITNATISHNEANGIPVNVGVDVAGLGGGVVNAGLTKPSILRIVNSTVAENYALAAGGGLATGLLDLQGFGTSTQLHNTIVAGNGTLPGTPANCLSLPDGAPSTFLSLGNNLEDGNSCNLTSPSDIVDTDPLLRPLDNYGGDTWTHALTLGSPAVDAAAPLVDVDQRGLPRPFGPGYDIGAYELVVFSDYLPLVIR
jgi:hypothetical protein